MRMKWRLLNVTALLAVSAGCSAREASPEQLLMRCEQGVGEGYLEARRALLARRDARKLLASGKETSEWLVRAISYRLSEGEAARLFDSWLEDYLRPGTENPGEEAINALGIRPARRPKGLRDVDLVECQKRRWEGMAREGRKGFLQEYVMEPCGVEYGHRGIFYSIYTAYLSSWYEEVGVAADYWFIEAAVKYPGMTDCDRYMFLNTVFGHHMTGKKAADASDSEVRTQMLALARRLVMRPELWARLAGLRMLHGNHTPADLDVILGNLRGPFVSVRVTALDALRFYAKGLERSQKARVFDALVDMYANEPDSLLGQAIEEEVLKLFNADDARVLLERMEGERRKSDEAAQRGVHEVERRPGREGE